MNKALIVLAAIVTLALSACVGGRLLLSADRAQFPVSLSPGIHSPQGKLLSSADYDSVGVFSRNYESWSLGWSLIPLTPLQKDISDDLNAAIREAGGDAAVNLKVSVGIGNLNRLLAFSMLALLPVTPSVHRVRVTADIVRIRG